MKNTDIAMIVLIASVGVLVAYFVAINIPFLNLPEDGVEVKTIQAITSDVKEPNKRIFNEEAINPTVEVVVGSDGTN